MGNTIQILQIITPYFGFATSVLFYLCPISLIYLLHSKQQKIENSTCVGIVASLINCTLWFTWGFSPYVLGEKKEFSVLDFCNLIGGILSLIYLTIYCYHYTKGYNWYFLFYLFSLYDITYEIIYFEIEFSRGNRLLPRTKEMIISWIASIFNILMYITPGMNIIRVFKTKNHQMISIIGSILGVINSFVWLFWGCVSMNDQLNLLHVAVANSIGLVLCISQVAIYYYYKKKNDQLNNIVINPEEKEEKEEKEDDKLKMSSENSLPPNPNNLAIFEF